MALSDLITDKEAIIFISLVLQLSLLYIYVFVQKNKIFSELHLIQKLQINNSVYEFEVDTSDGYSSLQNLLRTY